MKLSYQQNENVSLHVAWNVLLMLPYRGMLVMREDRTTGEWERLRLCIGDSKTCPGADVPPLFVASLGQDSDQEIYIVAIARDPVDPVNSGVLYQITDPTRCI
jgi:hypothetical protein